MAEGRRRGQSGATDRGKGGANNPEGANQHTPKDKVNDGIAIIDQSGGPASPPPARKRDTNDRPYAIRRLARQRPDLLEKVKAGEVSAHGAMVEAGFHRVPTILDILRPGGPGMLTYHPVQHRVPLPRRASS